MPVTDSPIVATLSTSPVTPAERAELVALGVLSADGAVLPAPDHDLRRVARTAIQAHTVDHCEPRARAAPLVAYSRYQALPTFGHVPSDL